MSEDLSQYIVRNELRPMGGTQLVYRFPNGYGVSVINGYGAYGGEDGLYELGVVRFTGDTFHLTYDTPITYDVIGYLTLEKAMDIAMEVKNLEGGAE